MKKLLFNLSLFFCIIVIINNAVFCVLKLPFYWGNEIAYAKGQYFLSHKSEFNTVFIGTSKTYKQTNVSVFDSLCGYRCHSFNFGIDGIDAAETFYYVDNLARSDSNIKYVFIEVFDIDLIIKQNLHTCREKYWHNIDATVFTLKSIWDSNYNFIEKCRGFAYNTLTFFEWLLKFDLLKDVARFKATPPNQALLGYNNKGYISLGEQSSGADIQNHKSLLADTSVSQKLRDASIRLFTNYDDSIKFNNANYNKLKQVVKSLSDKNIRVFLVLAPRLKEVQLSNVIGPFMKMDNCIKINLCDAKANPEFYQLNYTWDIVHLNSTGSYIYTAKIADAFNEAVPKQ